MDINALLASLSGSTQQSNKQLIDIAGMMGAATANEQAVNTRAQAGASADIPIATALSNQTTDVEYQRAQLVQKLQSEANLDPTVADNAYAAGLADLTTINSQRTQAASEVTRLSSMNLFDNPVGYIFAQLNLPTAIAKSAGLENQAAVVKDDVGARLDLLAKARSTVAANTSDAVKEIQYQGAELKAREAQRQLDTASAATQSKIAGQYLQQANIFDKVNDNTRQLVSMQIQAANWAESMAERREARAERAANASARMADKKTQQQQESMLSAGLAAAGKLLGYPMPIDLDSFKRLPNTPQKKAIGDLAVSGTLGGNLYDSLTSLASAAPNLPGIVKGGNAGFAKTLQWLDTGAQSFVSNARNAAAATGTKIPEKQLRETGVNNYESALVASAADPKGATSLTHPQWDSTPNLYKAQYKVLIDAAEAGSIPGLKGNVMVEAAKAMLPNIPGDAPNFRAADEQTLWNTVGTMVAKKQINVNEAAKQVARFYQTSAAYNQQFFQYGLVGLPAQSSYMVKLQTPGLVYGTNPVPVGDAMNEAAVKNMLLKIAKNQTAPVSLELPGAAVGTSRVGSWLTLN